MALSWDSADDGDSPDDVGNLSVTGLGVALTDSGYDVYIYSDSDNNERTFDITVTPDGGDGTTLTVVDSATFSGDLNEAGSGTDENYVVFRGLTAAGFTIDMKSTPGRGAVNAIQVVAVPEPASIVAVNLRLKSLFALRINVFEQTLVGQRHFGEMDHQYKHDARESVLRRK